MAKKPQQSHTISFQLDAKYLKPGLRTSLLTTSNELVADIGRIAAYWGDFEHRFDRIIAEFLNATKREVPGWETRSFRKRKTLLKELVVARFESKNPQAVKAFRKVISDAAQLHWRRNLIVHGIYVPTMAAGETRGTIEARGHHNGKPVSLPIDKPTLEQLWHDIAHLTGALYDAFTLVGRIDGLWLTFPDTQILQLLASSNRQSPPTPVAP